MKKRVLAVVLMLLLMLSGCQKTPDKEIVANKSGGLQEEAIIKENKSKEEKKIDAPKVWTEDKKNEKGFLEIHADIEPEVPKITNTPVKELKQIKISTEKLKKLVHLFAGNNELIKSKGMTLEELREERELIQEGEAAYGRNDSEAQKKMLSNVDELINKKKQQKEEIIPVEFGDYQQRDISYIRAGDYKTQASKDNREDLNAKNTFFRAEIKDDKKEGEYITAQNYNKNAGTTSEFTYWSGSVYTENELQLDKSSAKAARNTGFGSGQWREEYKSYTTAMEEAIKDTPKQSEEEAKTTADDLLEKAGAKGFGVKTVQKGIWVPEKNEGDATFDTNWSLVNKLDKKESGYMIIYSKSIDGLLAANPNYEGSRYMSLPTDTYYPPFYMEEIRVFVTAGGIKYFDWENMAEETSTIAANTKLLPFDEIKEKLMQYITYDYTSPNPEDNAGNKVLYTIDIKSARLQLAYIPAYKNPEHVWAVPVWSFAIDNHFEMQTDVFTINAIDGGYVSIYPQLN